MKLVPDAKDFYKWYSMHAYVFTFVMSIAQALLSAKDAGMPWYVYLVLVVLVQVGGAVGRVAAQEGAPVEAK
jgi:hypothetical protein